MCDKQAKARFQWQHGGGFRCVPQADRQRFRVSASLTRSILLGWRREQVYLDALANALKALQAAQRFADTPNVSTERTDAARAAVTALGNRSVRVMTSCPCLAKMMPGYGNRVTLSCVRCRLQDNLGGVAPAAAAALGKCGCPVADDSDTEDQERLIDVVSSVKVRAGGDVFLPAMREELTCVTASLHEAVTHGALLFEVMLRQQLLAGNGRLDDAFPVRRLVRQCIAAFCRNAHTGVDPAVNDAYETLSRQCTTALPSVDLQHMSTCVTFAADRLWRVWMPTTLAFNKTQVGSVICSVFSCQNSIDELLASRPEALPAEFSAATAFASVRDVVGWYVAAAAGGDHEDSDGESDSIQDDYAQRPTKNSSQTESLNAQLTAAFMLRNWMVTVQHVRSLPGVCCLLVVCAHGLTASSFLFVCLCGVFLLLL
jgi:hypothetical protein